ncbi:MAG TPA: SDR family oxidoreductase [Candidatus Sulfomarinibacteraceae bacterium]|nr:SDR family oxidoreductase [Candidatus Sulfomarinibacteraceae bacterium]
MLDFTHRIVLITGASRGIGRAAARAFAERGARVAIHYHQNHDAARETARQLEGNGARHLLVQADVKDPIAVEGMIEHVTETMGRLDVLVNNAGIFEEHPLVESDYASWQEAWQRTLATNLSGPANLAFCAARHMIEQGGGRIVNVSSRGAFRGEPDAPAYGASKAGLNAMGQSLAKYLAPYNVYVTTVAPGWVETDMASETLQGPEGDAVRRQSPLQRVARPEEVAYTILFLASEGAEFLTGTIVDINGASYLRT